MVQPVDMVIDKEIWDDLPDSTDQHQKDEVEERAKKGTLIVKDGDEQFRPVEVPEAGWQLEKLPKL